MPLREALTAQVALAAASGLEAMAWIERFAVEFRRKIEASDEFIRLVQSNPVAAQRQLEHPTK